MINRVEKYVIQIYIRELHDDLIKTNDECRLSEVCKNKNLLVSYTGLCFIIPTYVKTFTPRG